MIHFLPGRYKIEFDNKTVKYQTLKPLQIKFISENMDFLNINKWELQRDES